jgi:superfamily II DNA or RNA helicase
MELRPYQTAALDAILANYRKGVRRQVVVAATGTGKSAILSRIPALMRADLPGQMLVIVHTTELVQQNAEALRQANPDLKVSIEMADQHADPTSDIVMASVQTLGRANTSRLGNFDWDNFDICVADECHHSTCENYVRIFEAGGFLAASTHKLLIGFTATSQRTDGTPLKDVYEKIVFNYPIRQGMEEKYLCDLIGIRLDTRTLLDNIHTANGDFNQTELADAVDTDERNNIIVAGWLKEAATRKTVVFAVNIAHAQHLAEAFQDQGVAAEAVWGVDPERTAKLARHKSGETLVLTNVAMLTEGYNDPSLKCVVLAAPTKSNLRFTQCCGRGTRIFPGKENCMIIDVVDSTKKHSLISLPSLLGLPANLNLHGESVLTALETIEAALEKYPHIDMSGLQDLDKLDEYISQVNFWDAKFPAEVEQFSELRWHRSLDGFVLSLPDYEKMDIKQNILGTFDTTGVVGGRKVAGAWDSLEQAFRECDAFIKRDMPQHLGILTREAKWHAAPATDKQMATLKKLLRGTGRVIPFDISKGEASRVIGQQIAAFKPRPARPQWLQSKIDREKKRA